MLIDGVLADNCTFSTVHLVSSFYAVWRNIPDLISSNIYEATRLIYVPITGIYSKSKVSGQKTSGICMIMFFYLCSNQNLCIHFCILALIHLYYIFNIVHSSEAVPLDLDQMKWILRERERVVLFFLATEEDLHVSC